MKAKAKRVGPIKINLGFDEAMKLALKVTPPPGGWKALERASKNRRRRTHKSVTKSGRNPA